MRPGRWASSWFETSSRSSESQSQNVGTLGIPSSRQTPDTLSLRLTGAPARSDFAPGFAHVPLDVVGEHAREDVGTHAIGEPMVDGPHFQGHLQTISLRGWLRGRDSAVRTFSYLFCESLSELEDSTGIVEGDPP